MSGGPVDDEGEAEIDRLLASLGLDLPDPEGDQDNDALPLALEEADEIEERGGWVGRCPRYDQLDEEEDYRWRRIAIRRLFKQPRNSQASVIIHRGNTGTRLL